MGLFSVLGWKYHGGRGTSRQAKLSLRLCEVPALPTQKMNLPVRFHLDPIL